MALKIAPLFSGSSGNSILIKTDETSILVDAGVSCSRIADELDRLGESVHMISGIVVTHEHSDHIKGIDVLMRKYDIPVYANEATMCELETKLKDPSVKNMRVIDDSPFYINDLAVLPFHTPHDAKDPFGYTFIAGSKQVSVMTDIGKVTGSMINAVSGSSIVLLESNHDVEMLKAGKYTYQLKRRILSGIGHLSNDDAGDAALKLVAEGTKGIILGHLSINNNIETLAFRTVANSLEAGGVAVGKQVGLMMAKRDCATGMFDAL